jgi:ABC-type transport system involved in multi-copper enzyme maturation permease subunit
MSGADPGGVPGTLSTLWTMAGVTLRRLRRGKALWIGILIAGLPVVNAIIVRTYAGKLHASPDEMFVTSLVLLALLPAMFVGASIGEEIEERTSTYLWSRPIARWAVLAGKLSALTPIVIALIVGGWCAATLVWTAHAPMLISCVALAIGCVAASLVATGIATLVPKHGMALTIGYLLVDLFIGALPFSLRELSITHQVHLLAQVDGDPPVFGAPLVAMLVVAGLWSVIAVARIQRIEA